MADHSKDTRKDTQKDTGTKGLFSKLLGRNKGQSSCCSVQLEEIADEEAVEVSSSSCRDETTQPSDKHKLEKQSS